MSRVRPFVGLLFDRSVVGDLDVVTTPPYDVISDTDRRRFLGASPYNVIRLDLGRTGGGDGDEDGQYRRAALDLRSWLDAGALVPTPRPSYFAYEMRFSLHGASRTILGIVCAVELEGPGGSIVPHERTMEAPIEDRLRLMRAVRSNVSCIQTVCEGPNEDLAIFLDAATRSEPAATTTDEAGVHHRLWGVPPDPRVAGWLASETLMIADGHHRYATALRYRDEMRASDGPGPWDRVMALVVDASLRDPPVLPFHRVQTRGSAHRAGRRVRDLTEVLECLHPSRLRYGIASIEEDVLVHRVAELAGEPPAVAALHAQVLDRLNADLHYTPDAAEAESAVRDRSAIAAYFLPSADPGQIRAVIERGDRLPPKSTFFWPKPRSGLVIRSLDLDADPGLGATSDRAPVSRPRSAPAS